jgi:hypothetical protein
MKKILIGFALVTLSITFNACDKLDLTPEDYYASGSFWKTPSQVDGAMVGLHNQLRGYQSTLFTLGELRGGTLSGNTLSFSGTTLNSTQVIVQNLKESSPGISGWAGFYASIFQVNNFIYQVEKANYLVATEKSYYLGQAYGLRAFYYFQLYKTFGRVPLIKEPKVAITTPTTAQDSYLPRTATEKETFDFIKEDVNKSVASFSGITSSKMQKAQWSLGASQMLQAEVYLWSAKVKIDGATPTTTTADLAVAKAAVEAVMIRYTLQPSFANVFNTAAVASNKGNPEIIFAMRYGFGEAQSFYNNFVYAAVDNFTGYVDDKGVAVPSDPLKMAGANPGTILRYEYKYPLYQKYDVTDTRANVTFFNVNKGAVSAIYMRKFIGTIVDGARTFSDDFPIYRLADAILMLAEIKNKLGQDPSAEINTIRTRAYAGGGGVAPLYVNGSFEQNELAIFAERQKEFVAEGKIWYDLRRMQDASGNPLVFRKDLPLTGVLDDITGQNHKLLWPIDLGTLTSDQTLLDAQNPFYKGT